jgi:hypothetical protein
MLKKVLLLLLATFVFIACSNNVQKEPESEPEQPKTVQKSDNVAQKGGLIVEGKVLETKDVEPYTYILLGDGSGNSIWAAIPKTKVEIGKVVVLENGFMMKDFKSKTLNKTFDQIIFASGIADKKPKVVEQKPLGETGAVGSKASRAAFIGEKVEKAKGANAYTVEEIFTNASKLNKQKVVVRGKAIKVLENIMGKNWIHIQDGTGSKEKANYDLVVTTKEPVEMDSVITIEGTLETNKDFGYGYKYDVIIEDAKIVK